MKTFIKIIRWIFSKFLLLVMAGVLFATILAYAIVPHMSNRETPKRWLSEAEVYGSVIDHSLKLLQQESDGGASLDEAINETPLDKERLIDVFRNVYDEAFLSQGAEEVIDGFYNWIEGSSERPEFYVSLAEKQNELAAKLSDVLRQELASLPACPSEQANEEFNPLSASCLPPGVSLDSLIDDFTQQLNEEGSFLSEATLDSSNIDIDQEATKNVRAGFDAASTFLILGPLLVIALAALVILIEPGWLPGARNVGRTLLSVGIVQLIVFFISDRIRDAFLRFGENENGNDIPEGVARDIVQPLYGAIIGDIARSGMMIAGLVCILGFAMWLTAFVAMRKKRIETERQEKPFLHNETNDPPLTSASEEAGSTTPRIDNEKSSSAESPVAQEASKKN